MYLINPTGLERVVEKIKTKLPLLPSFISFLLLFTINCGVAYLFVDFKIFSSKQLQQQAVQKSSPANSGYEQIFFELIGKNDSASLKEIIVLNPQLVKLLLQMTDEFNQNALLIAVKLNNPIMCEYLIGLGRKSDLAPHDFLEHCDSTGWTSLRYSAWMGYDCVVKVLLENGAHVDESDSEGRTALRAACFNGHQSVVDVLLKYRADGKFFNCYAPLKTNQKMSTKNSLSTYQQSTS